MRLDLVLGWGGGGIFENFTGMETTHVGNTISMSARAVCVVLARNVHPAFAFRPMENACRESSPFYSAKNGKRFRFVRYG